MSKILYILKIAFVTAFVSLLYFVIDYFLSIVLANFSLDLLVKSEYIELENFTNPGELFPKFTDNYIVTPLGDRYFQNETTINKLEKKKYRSKLLIEIMRSVVFPTIVAFITAMLTTKFLK